MMSCRAALRRFALVVLCTASLTQTASAQLPQVRIYAIFPQGAQAGQSVDVAVTNGVDLDELTGMSFSHPGITAEHTSGSNFKVTVAPDVPAGVYDARVHGLFGTSNPRCFVVGNRPEVVETEGNNTREQAQAVEVGTVINARSNSAADVDFFKFNGTKGQRILAECSAIRIDSRFHGELRIYSAKGRRLGRSIALERRFDPLLDVTLPEDGEYFVRVSDFVYAGSNDYGYRLTVHDGPHIDFVLPPAGVPGSTAKYTLFGRNLPGGQPGGIGSDGRELQKLQVDITLPATPDQLQPGHTVFAREAVVDGGRYAFKGSNGTSNAVTIAFAPRAAVVETEPNNEAAQSQKITIPAEIGGQFQVRGDVDRFEFEAKAGQVFWVEAFAQRLGSLADPYLLVEQVTKNDDGTETIKRLATVDDDGTTAISTLFETNHDDVAWRFAVPADGLYRVVLQDRFGESRGAANFSYHLAIREEELDFRLAVIPPAPLQNTTNGHQIWSLGLRKGDNLHVQVAALRRHGFKGVIDVVAGNLPAGITCSGASIDGASNAATLVFTAAEDVKPGTWPVKIVGKAHVESRAAVAAVTAAEAALKKLTDAQPNLQAALDKTVDPLKKAEDARKAAEAVAKTDADAAKKAEEVKTAADKKLTDAQAAQKTADEAKVAADKALTDAKTAAGNATTALDVAKKELEADKENQGLKDKVAAAEKAKTDADQAVTTADTGAKDAATKAADAKKLTDQSKAEADAAAKALTAAAAKAKQTADALAKAVTARDQAQAAFRKAEDAKKAGETAIAAAQKTITEKRKAQADAARDVAHSARTATIVWNGSNVLSATSRLSNGLALSVINEDSPFQVTSEVVREDVSHNRQILIPVKLAKRNGFNADVQLTFQNIPKNLQVQNLKVTKDQTEAVVRVFVPNNVAEGTYTLYMQAQGQVSYSRNPARAERAKKAQEEVVAALTAATEAAKKATEAATAANNEVTAATQALQKAQQERDAEKKKLTDAQAAEQKATQEKAAADKAVADTQAAADTAAKAATDAKAAADQDTANQDLAKAAEDAARNKTDADAALKTAQDGQKAADEKLKAAQTATKTATDAVTAKEKAATDAEAAVKTKTEAKAAADKAKADADAKVKEVTANKANADKELKAATDAAKAKNINVFAPSTPLTIKVRKGGFTLTANVPDGGNLKRGQKMEVKVTLKRVNGFTGPVTVKLAPPPGTQGLASEPLTIAADQTEGTLVVTAAGDATEGDIANLVVRGTADWNGPSSADIAVKVKVQK